MTTKHNSGCRFCGYCRIVDRENMQGICTEPHGPRNARGELGKQVPLSMGTCEHFILHANMQDRNRRARNKQQAEEERMNALLE